MTLDEVVSADSIPHLLRRERRRSGLRYPVELPTGVYLIEGGRSSEWVHKLVSVREDGVPVYTTGLVERGPVRVSYGGVSDE